ncbi:DUF5610 domain-containing protein [Vogesella indigofera]|uniref:DUF5610 domain-containing protein n=1 Tax=Vogesella indigofera TaxID=45465 RepID=UPI00234E9459|nr:DUF5610 domain-containing protein [Vogesella indigofera]MDC7707876.1 DUF5610 domain-containing protein [Vogesella indigofera]
MSLFATPGMSSLTPAAQNSQASNAPGRLNKPSALERSARDEMNAQVIDSLNVSIGAGNKSQQLLYRSAIDKINELLAPDFGADALQAAATKQDNTAEATAERILSLSLGFYDAYAKQNPDKSTEELANGFVSLVRSGFEKGFNEAKDILEGLKVWGGTIATDIQKTYELVQKGYDDFLASKLPAASTTDSSA